MKIAICDDEELFVRKMYQFLWQQPDCTVECFLSPPNLWKNIMQGHDMTYFSWMCLCPL